MTSPLIGQTSQIPASSYRWAACKARTASIRQLINSGAAYRLTPTRQVDFHVGFGLNHNAPNWFFGLGYSFRRDGLRHEAPAAQVRELKIALSDQPSRAI